MWKLDRSGKETLPLYLRLVRLIENGLDRGDLKPGERLPSERRLAVILGLNRSTVIRALNDLADRGVVLRKTGSGTYVNPEKWGVQSYRVLNWRSPPAPRTRAADDAFLREAAALRAGEAQAGAPALDLSRDDLPGALFPQRPVPKISWKELIRAERGEEGSHLGLSSFRQAVRSFLRRRMELDAPLEQILITSGTRQAIFLITQCLLSPGDAVGVELPSYFYSLPVFQAAGLRLCALPMDREGVTPEGLEALASRLPLRMVFLNPLFHNPTGACMGEGRKRDILRICSARHLPIVEDDASSLLAFRPGMAAGPMKRQDSGHRVIYLGSLSSYAGRNLRAGWMVAPEPVIRQLAEVRHMMDAGLSVLPQFLGERYLDLAADAHIEDLRRILAERAAALARHLADLCGDLAHWEEPAGGLYLYARLNSGSEQDRTEFLRRLFARGIIPARGSD
ncbi:MAG: PLP-dependent aminotransferase family protein, partial [Desulfovibrio sp.]|nr:PLP-dependent aminotransferase family protein [Desulfovibrio sp.]